MQFVVVFGCLNLPLLALSFLFSLVNSVFQKLKKNNQPKTYCFYVPSSRLILAVAVNLPNNELKPQTLSDPLSTEPVFSYLCSIFHFTSLPHSATLLLSQ